MQELNHLSAIPESPTQFSGLSRSMLWLTVSNAALRSSSTSTDILPESELKGISFIILMSAVMRSETRLKIIQVSIWV